MTGRGPALNQCSSTCMGYIWKAKTMDQSKLLFTPRWTPKPGKIHIRLVEMGDYKVDNQKYIDMFFNIYILKQLNSEKNNKETCKEAKRLYKP